MTTTLTVATNDLTAYLQHRSLSVSRNGCDFTLIDPSDVPVVDDDVVLTDPAWTGTINAIEEVAYHGDKPFYKCRAKNEDALPDNGAGAFNLSDNPNGSTTFGFDDLQIIRTLNTETGTEEVRAKCRVFEPGLEAGDEIALTSAAHGFSAETFTIMELTTSWPTKDDAPQFALDLGLGDYETSTEAGLDPITLETRITEIVIGNDKHRIGDLLLGDSQHFATSVGNWTNSGGALVRDTTAGYRYATHAASLKFTTTADSQYIECPVPGVFAAGREYQALMLIRAETEGTGHGRAIELGVIGTDSEQSQISYGFTVDGSYSAMLVRWRASAERTGVTLRFTRTDASMSTIVFHIGWARVVGVIPNNDVGVALFRSPDTDDPKLYGSSEAAGSIVLKGGDEGGELVLDWFAARLTDDQAAHSVDVTDTEVAIYSEHTPGDLTDLGLQIEVGDDSLGLHVSEKDTGTIQLYPDADIDVELRDRGTGRWIIPASSVENAGRWEVLLTEDGSEPITTEDGLDYLYAWVTD